MLCWIITKCNKWSLAVLDPSNPSLFGTQKRDFLKSISNFEKHTFSSLKQCHIQWVQKCFQRQFLLFWSQTINKSFSNESCSRFREQDAASLTVFEFDWFFEKFDFFRDFLHIFDFFMIFSKIVQLQKRSEKPHLVF